MDDKHDRRGGGEPKDGIPFPWETEAEAPGGRPSRHDAFTPGRRRTFLKHLAKTGCIADAARLTGVTARTIYNHQEKDAEFARHCELAIKMAGGGIEQIAWERAVAGVSEQFACGGKVYTRTRYSDGLLRLLLQGANPGKYGPRPGFTRKRIKAWERKEMEREIRREIATAQPTFDEAMSDLERRVEAVMVGEYQERLEAGWSRTGEGDWIPPGWIRDPDFVPPPVEKLGDGTPRDSV